MSEPSPTPPAKHDDTLPLPGWLTKVYYVFPVVLYVPDMIFNFFVYSDGSGVDFNNITILSIPQLALWGFLSAGIVGMAWLLSVLAPWHWARGNRFQSMMCWFGVVLATSITMWNSLAYRSEKFKSFKTDSLFGTTNISSFSLTMIIVALAPPFWGLFWAIVQPAQPKRSAEAERESHQQRMERLRQEAEIKQVKAAANAQIRAAQISGFAATARAARAQLGAAMSGNEAPAPPMVEGSITVEEEPAAPALLPPAEERHEGRVVRLDERVSRVANDAEAQRTGARPSPKPGTKAFRKRVQQEIARMEARLEPPTAEAIAYELNESLPDVASEFNAIMAERHPSNRY